MPICKKCQNRFPNLAWINGKKRNLQSRKYCLDCSPFGEHNTRDLDSPTKGDVRVCQRCNCKYIYLRRGETLIHCNSCCQKKRLKEFKKWAIEYKGGSCIKCGYNKCSRSLVFHHINPKEKEYVITNMYNRSQETKIKELNKCELLCANCHGEVHEYLDRIKYPNSSSSK